MRRILLTMMAAALVVIAGCSPGIPQDVTPIPAPTKASATQVPIAATPDTVGSFEATVIFRSTWVVPTAWKPLTDKRSTLTFVKHDGVWQSVDLGVPDLNKGPLFDLGVSLWGSTPNCGFNMSSTDGSNGSIMVTPTDNCAVTPEEAKEVVVQVTLSLPYCNRPQDGVSKVSSCKFGETQFGYLGYSIDDPATSFEFVFVGAYSPEMREPLQQTIMALGFDYILPDTVRPNESVTLRK